MGITNTGFPVNKYTRIDPKSIRLGRVPARNTSVFFVLGHVRKEKPKHVAREALSVVGGLGCRVQAAELPLNACEVFSQGASPKPRKL